MVSRGGSRPLCCALVLKSSCIKYRQGVFDKLYVLSNVKHNKTQYFIVFSVTSKPCKACPALLSGHFQVIAIATFPLHIVLSYHIVHFFLSFCLLCLYVFNCQVFPIDTFTLFAYRFSMFLCFRMVSCFHAFCFLCVSCIFFYPIGLVGINVSFW